MSQEYKVMVDIEAWVSVKADSIEAAKTKANEYITNFDFGKMSDINWDLNEIVDEQGGLYYV